MMLTMMTILQRGCFDRRPRSARPLFRPRDSTLNKAIFCLDIGVHFTFLSTIQAKHADSYRSRV
jgi:hypothetical protein